MIPFIFSVHRIFDYISFMFPVFPFSSTTYCIFQATELVTSCLSFTICLAIRKVLFWFSELFRSLAISVRLFSFAKDRHVVFFAHWLLSLYFSHESWPFFLPFSIQHLLNFMPQWPHHSTTMFLYVDACLLIFRSSPRRWPSRLELRCVRPSVRPYVHKKFFRFPSNFVCG